MSLRIQLKQNRFMTLISVYVPTLASSQDDIDRFYADLSSVIQKIDRNDKLIILGNFNARVGQDFDTWSCLGRHGTGKCNGNGQLLLQFCQEFGLMITNTCFRQKDKFKITWKHPRSRHWHILDYVIVRRRNIRDVLSVRCMRSAECWTDHRLMRATMSLYVIRKIRYDVRVPKHIDVSQLSSGEKQVSLREAVQSITITEEKEPSKAFSEKLYKTAASVLGYSKAKNQDWFRENSPLITGLLNEKRLLWERLLAPDLNERDRLKLEKDFKNGKTKVQREIRAAKDKWWSEKACQIQSSEDRRDTKSLYHQLRSVYGTPVTSHTPLRSKDGLVLLTKPDDIKKRSREHHSELLNRVSQVSVDAHDDLEQAPVIQELDALPTREEVEDAVQQRNTGKAPGKDGITAELLKQGGEKTVQLLFETFQKLWIYGTTPKD